MTAWKEGVTRALFEVLKPLARLMLRFGVSYRDFEEQAKLAFVKISISEYGVRGRPTNVSRVAVMTGLSRREVRYWRERLVDVPAETSRDPPALADVLHFWQQDPEFLNAEGEPLDLPYAGSGPSFQQLAGKYARDIPPGAVRAELRRLGAIRELKGGLLRLENGYFIPSENEEKLRISLLYSLRGLVSTLEHNTDPHRIVPGWIERYVSSPKLEADEVEALRMGLREEIERFTLSLDKGLAIPERRDVSGKGCRIGIGVYYVEDYEGSDDDDSE